MNHFRDIDLNEKIVHSDHGFQYSSTDFVSLSIKKNFLISMSRIGNSLDNREVEYFFSNIKSEKLNFLPKNISFENMKIHIKKYIDWYNKERPQSILQWKTPKQFAQMRI